MKELNVKFVISKGGEIKMDVTNGVGESCMLQTKSIADFIEKQGASSVDVKKKPEFYEEEESVIEQDFLNS